jgi:hypothetical protein
VKYQHLLPGFVDDAILGYKFDGISSAFDSLSNLGVCPDLLEMRRDPISMAYGPLDKNFDEEIYASNKSSLRSRNSNPVKK